MAVTLIVWVPLPEQVAVGIAGWVVIEGAVLTVTVIGFEVTAGEHVPLTSTS